MTFSSFLNAMKTVNLAILALMWVGFWGYGVVVQDIPPLSVIPGLLLISICVLVTITVSAFALCHIALFLKHKLDGTFPPFKKHDYLAAFAGLIGVGTLVLIDILDPTNDYLVPFAVIAGVTFTYGVGYAALVFFSQFFRWQFSPSS